MEERRLKFIRQYDQRLTEFLEKEENLEIRRRLEPLFYKRAEEIIIRDKANIRFDETIGKKASYVKRLVSEKKDKVGNKPHEVAHNPEETVAFLKAFTREGRLKYLTHYYGDGDFDYNIFIEKCGNQFINLLKAYPSTPYRLIAKINRFLLWHDDKRGWGGDGIVIGFRTPSVAEYVRTTRKHPCFMELDMPIRIKGGGEIHTFQSIMDKFRREIRFAAEPPDFFRWIKQLVKKNKLHFHNTEISPSLRKVDFYIDVDQLRDGLSGIMKGIRDRPLAKEVKIDLIDKGAFFELTIDQYGQKIDRSSPNHEKVHPTTISGDFKDARDINFRGVCDWSFEGTFQDGKVYRINYLDSLGRDIIEEEGDFFTEGVRHTLRLFK
ncbi:hypothetical protein [Phaeodactylibacter xiamenensis]|uniref:hypothetical protein n=1 Tax=Phaeodactylibacter xiamenensis TaxID=1524460 RepID=UPI0024A7B0DC|nr:hypothetical protein [Phaeodactylibacter xiamenensis]